MRIGKYIVLRNARLGDKVHAVAQPIAKVIDQTLGTKIQGCSACKRRRDRLNGITQTPNT